MVTISCGVPASIQCITAEPSPVIRTEMWVGIFLSPSHSPTSDLIFSHCALLATVEPCMACSCAGASAAARKKTARKASADPFIGTSKGTDSPAGTVSCQHARDWFGPQLLRRKGAILRGGDGARAAIFSASLIVQAWH